MLPLAPISPPAAQPETEWQFDALDLRPVEAWLLAGHDDFALRVVPGVADDLLDTYLDTADWRFHRAGFGLRLRQRGERLTATLKTLADARDGLRQRLEISEPLVGDGIEALRQAPGSTGQRARAVAGRQPLQAIFEVHTHRRRYAVVIDAAQVAEVALDDTAVPVGDAAEPFRLRRVEVEIVQGAVADLQPFVERMRAACGLQTAILSKYDLGLFARGLQPAGPPHLGPAAVHEAQSLGEAAFAILRRHFRAFLAHEPGTRLGDDPEELHDMRVAARRLRAAMRLFAAALPARVPRLRQELRWVAAALGEVRDLDVQIEQIRAWIGQADEADRDALHTLAVLIEERRGAARRRMLRVLDSVRFERLVAAHVALLQRGPSRRAPQARAPVLQAAPPLVSRRYRQVRKLGGRLDPASPPEDYHALRIRCKQLRYALEFFREIYGKPAEALIERLVRLQDILGGHQDAYVAMAHLRELAVSAARRLPPQAIFAMGGIAQRYAQQAADLRAEFPAAFRRFKGRPWRRLRRALEARQPAAPAPRAPASLPQPKSPSPSE